VLKSFFLTFIAIFVALDIIGMLPIYVMMTQGQQAEERKQTANSSMQVAFLVAVVFLFLGDRIFHYLGITISDFKISGGIVLLLIALADLVGKPEAENRSSGSTGIVPLAVPLITGPAVLASLVLQVNVVGYVITLLAMTANYLLAWLVLRKSETITRFIGRDGTVVISKIVALLLAAFAVAMIRSGVFGAIATFRAG
jgi:multiple antibiotic resistance protein